MQQLNIENGASVSGELKLKPDYLAAIQMPAAWTAALLTIEGSLDGANFFQCYDGAGEALSLTVDADRIIVLAPEATKGLVSVRLRSGTVAAPVNQAAARTLKVEVADV